ncbi:hypothetical protein [Malaciobacter mytili]|uniref:DUF3139 domain-containing protein n=1 Tax=Malaciobacter mytili LMG 24559 TaxID=1032238 RepID=A0AAX2AED0_9BACT|nr:hypothetical protein [Malaciobacter mytili]AXH15965.1 hypothetical protein AMYT_2430 [Malaciobacter mytili LMG 24559]RXK13682.1 hypothetical protein CP985_13425 [Malaciobacter mytili LMG 24559]
MENEIRKIPKKSKIIILILTLLAIMSFLVITYLKELKIKGILNSLGYTQISSVKVINKLSVEDKDTKRKGTVYKVLFFNNKTNQECIGFLHKDKSNKYFEDFDCK